ncbi:MAG: YbaN family protein [Gemmatales bacterium]|nr:YbaN family protein [Gemmatales bacterium]MDW8386015.1 YbaN family protein [Gemmatales bacterium]
MSLGPDPILSGPRQWLCIGLGLLFVGLGAAGTVLPLVPTTPFLLLASYFFVRSSPRLTRWLHSSRLWGPMLHTWRTRRAVSRRVKFTAVVVLLVSVAVSLWLARPSWPILIVFLVLVAIGLTVVLRLPTLPSSSVEAASIAEPHPQAIQAADADHDQA